MGGSYTPRLQRAITRLSSKLPYREAADEVEMSHHTAVAEATCRRLTYRHGGAAEAIACQRVLELEANGVTEAAQPPGWLQVSADGSFIQLVNGEWREVKSIAVGEIQRSAPPADEVKTENITYFSRSYRARQFERFALSELQHRGLDQAEQVVAVNDGAEWIQSFIDYHCPEAVRILDFTHALDYIIEVSQALWGEGHPEGQQWIRRMAHQLKHVPPQETLANLRLLLPKAKRDDQAEVLDRALRYLQKRETMIDYPYFRQRGYPIGSGSVESGHKQVVHRRLKGAGMRWAPQHVDPLLALRDLLCNDRWQAGWDDIVSHCWHERHRQQRHTASALQPAPKEPITFAALEAAGLLATPAELEQTQPAQSNSTNPAKDHPWRRDIWPTKEAWRWN